MLPMIPTMKVIYLITLLNLIQFGGSAKILGFFPIPSKSHQQMFRAIWTELALRNHDVTVISTDILNDSMTNLKEIDVSYRYNKRKGSNLALLMKDTSTITKVLSYNKMLGPHILGTLEDEKVVELIRSDENFDLVIVQAIHPLMFTITARYKVPVVAISSYGVMLNLHDAIGNPTHPVITPDLLFSYDNYFMNFFDKVNTVLYNILYRIWYYWYELPNCDKIARKYIGNDMPYLGDIINNVSMIIVNTNPILHPVRANVPNIIEVNQVHIRENERLPQDIQTFLDWSTNGVVYFSLGSNIKSIDLSNDTKQEIFLALSELPYNVLWKWEADHLPGQPQNVLIKKWLPQQDVLSHPNVKVFVTQGGLQSLEEAIAKGVPVVGIPFMSDQPRNMECVKHKGLGLRVDPDELTKKVLKDAILEVAQNEKYKETVLKARRILLDQPMKGVEKAVWWIEYVIRQKDVSHLKSPATKMSFIEYLLIDVILFLISCFVIIFYVSKKMFSLIWRLSNPNSSNKQKVN